VRIIVVYWMILCRFIRTHAGIARLLIHLIIIDGHIFVGESFILRSVDICEGVCVETLTSLVFSEILLNDNGGTMKFD